MTAAMFTRPSAVDDELGVPIPFRPQDYIDCAALVLEPLAKQLTRFQGKDRLEVVAKVYVFETEEDVREGRPAEVIPLVVTWGRIASLLSRANIDGNLVAARIGQDPPTKYGTRPWTLQDLDPETEAYLARWLQSRREREEQE